MEKILNGNGKPDLGFVVQDGCHGHLASVLLTGMNMIVGNPKKKKKLIFKIIYEHILLYIELND